MLDSRNSLREGRTSGSIEEDLRASACLETSDQAERCVANRSLECAGAVIVEGDYGV
jgi:hypothetical protein